MSFFGDRLRERREERGIKRQELATLLGVSRNTLGLWERGERHPRSLEILCELADILQVPVMYFSAPEAQVKELQRNPVIREMEHRLSCLEHTLDKKRPDGSA